MGYKTIKRILIWLLGSGVVIIGVFLSVALILFFNGRKNLSEMDVWAYSLEDKAIERITQDGNNIEPRVSPDNRKIAFIHYTNPSMSGMEAEIKIIDIKTKKEVILDKTATFKSYVCWGINNSEIYFVDHKQNRFDVTKVNIESNQKQVVCSVENEPYGLKISYDGKWLSFTHDDEKGYVQVYVVSIDGNQKKQLSKNEDLLYRPGFAWDRNKNTIHMLTLERKYELDLDGNVLEKKKVLELYNPSSMVQAVNDEKIFYVKARRDSETMEFSILELNEYTGSATEVFPVKLLSSFNLSSDGTKIFVSK